MSKETLQEKVSRLFSKKPGEHDWKVTPEIDICRKCGCKGYNTSPCHTSDPIDITDLGKALECFRGLEHKEASLLKWWKKECERNGLDGFGESKGIFNALLAIESYLLNDGSAEELWEINCLAKD